MRCESSRRWRELFAFIRVMAFGDVSDKNRRENRSRFFFCTIPHKYSQVSALCDLSGQQSGDTWRRIQDVI